MNKKNIKNNKIIFKEFNYKDIKKLNISFKTGKCQAMLKL